MRFTICNMTAEFGGLNGIFEADGVVADWLARRRRATTTARCYFRADDDAPYVARYPHRARRSSRRRWPSPSRPTTSRGRRARRARRSMACFIGACTTTEEELVLAALVLEQALPRATPRSAAAAKRIVVPGDLSIQENLRAGRALGDLRARRLQRRPAGLLDVPGRRQSARRGKGEVWLCSQNRNFENRMGEGSLAWLACAATVAACALDMQRRRSAAAAGARRPRPLRAHPRAQAHARRCRRSRIAEPQIARSRRGPAAQRRRAPAARHRCSAARAALRRLGGHRRHHPRRVLPPHQARGARARRRSTSCGRSSRERAQGGRRPSSSAGEGWGSGSSREQAVWALQGVGIQAVIAKSYAFIHKRNLVNEALPYLVITRRGVLRAGDRGRGAGG